MLMVYAYNPSIQWRQEGQEIKGILGFRVWRQPVLYEILTYKKKKQNRAGGDSALDKVLSAQ